MGEKTRVFSVKFFFKTMNLIYFSFVGSGIILCLISFYLWGFDINIRTELSFEKQLILGIFVIVSTFLSQFIYRRAIRRINDNDQIIIKLQSYQAAVIYRMSILEFTLVITVLFFIFTKIWSFLFISFALLFLLFLCKPTKYSLFKLLPLSEEEKILIINNS